MAGSGMPTLRVHWSLHAITYPLLFAYFLPVLVILAVTVMTDVYVSDESGLLAVAPVIAGPYFETLRATMGAIFVPFVMAYAVKDRQADQPLPGSTLAIFCVFLGFFLLATILYGLIEWRAPTVSRTTFLFEGREVPVTDFLRSTMQSYAKESLTYIALVLGIALRPATSAAAAGRKPEDRA
jgi:hypothetical protein